MAIYTLRKGAVSADNNCDFSCVNSVIMAAWIIVSIFRVKSVNVFGMQIHLGYQPLKMKTFFQAFYHTLNSTFQENIYETNFYFNGMLNV